MTCYVPPGSKKTPGPVIKVNSVSTLRLNIITFLNVTIFLSVTYIFMLYFKTDKFS